LAGLETLAHQASPVRLVSQARKVTVVSLVTPEPRDPLGPRATPVNLGQLVHQDSPEHAARPDHAELRALPDRLDFQARKETRVPLEERE